jgi:Aspartyl protease
MRMRSVVIAGLLLLVACSCSLSPSTSQQFTENVRVVRGPNNATAVLLPVMIHGQGPFTFELDTGASTSLIAPSLVQRLKLQSAGKTQTISGIGGVQQATPVSISNWNTGPIRLPTANIVSAVIPHERGSNLEGLIGSDIWSRFGKFTLDYNSGTLTVYKQIATASGKPTTALDVKLIDMPSSVGLQKIERKQDEQRNASASSV